MYNNIIKIMLDVVNMIQIKTHICKFIFNFFYLFYLPGGSINTSFFKTNKKNRKLWKLFHASGLET